tara:strand:+ start:638 stop:1081 length:444 start_codon:yes stop_codon:yes gene_type:complete
MSKLRNGKLYHGDRVEIYRNLNNGTHSIRRNGKVVKHLQHHQSIFLKDVKFAVQPAGREKVRREGRKNVHAFVRGTVIMPSTMNCTTDEFKDKMPYCVQYNPYHTDHFGCYMLTGETDKKGRPCNAWTHIYEAKLATFTGGYLYAAI